MSFEKNNSIIIIIISIVILVVIAIILLINVNKKSSNTTSLTVQEKKILNVPIPPVMTTTYSTTGTTYPIFTKVSDKTTSGSNLLDAKVKNSFNYNANTNELTATKFTGASNAVFSSTPTQDNEKLIYQTGTSTTNFIPKPTNSGIHVLTSNGDAQLPSWKKLNDVLRAQGAKGTKGLPGSQGPQGDKGLPGSQGPQGDKGLTGIQGPRGLQGDKGPKGNDGYLNVLYNYYIQGNGGTNNYYITDSPSVNQLGFSRIGANGNYGSSNTIFTGFPHTFKDYKTALANEFGKSGLVWSSADETISFV